MRRNRRECDTSSKVYKISVAMKHQDVLIGKRSPSTLIMKNNGRSETGMFFFGKRRVASEIRQYPCRVLVVHINEMNMVISIMKVNSKQGLLQRIDRSRGTSYGRPTLRLYRDISSRREVIDGDFSLEALQVLFITRSMNGMSLVIKSQRSRRILIRLTY